MPRILTFAIFLFVLSAFIFVANVAVYGVLALIFAIYDTVALIFLGSALGLLSGSFIMATVIGTRYHNVFTRIYYTLSAVWMGFFTYLFLISAVYSVVLILFGEIVPLVGYCFVALAAVLSAYGLFHARTIVVTRVPVTLSHLPGIWKGRRVVWVSDVHLGQLHSERFAQKVVKKIQEIPHDIVCIGGDLFDGTGAPDISELIAPFATLTAPLGVFFVTGNHEEFGDNATFLSAIRNIGIRTLVDEVVDIDGVQIVGVDYKNASDAKRFADILDGFSLDREKPSILLKHEPKDLGVAERAGISLQISGHTHRAQMWPLSFIAKMVYKGYEYGLKPLGSMQVYTSSGVGTWGPPLRVGTDSEIVVLEF